MPARKVQAKGGRGGTKTTPAEGGSLWDDVKEAWANDKAKSTNAQLARIDASAKGGDMWDDIKAMSAYVQAEPVKEDTTAKAIGAGLKKTTSAKGRKGKKALVLCILTHNKSRKEDEGGRQ